MIKKDQEGKQETNTETYLKKEKKSREYEKKTDTLICLKKKKKKLKEYQKSYCDAKNSQSNNQ